MQENVILSEYQSSEDEGSCDSYFFFIVNLIMKCLDYWSPLDMSGIYVCMTLSARSDWRGEDSVWPWAVPAPGLEAEMKQSQLSSCLFVPLLLAAVTCTGFPTASFLSWWTESLEILRKTNAFFPTLLFLGVLGRTAIKVTNKAQRLRCLKLWVITQDNKRS